MKNRNLLGAVFAALVSVAGPAAASHGHGDISIDQRQHRLETRIEQGLRAGELTRHEYRRLRHGLAEIERAERHFAADGRLTPRERDDLHARLDHLAREVYRERHDAEQRYGSYNHDYRAERRY